VRQPRIGTLFGTLAVLAATAPLAAQQKVALGKPLAETEESFTSISSLRELPSGKVLVADQRDRIVQLVDLAGGTLTKVGREGSGPGEYAFPGTLIGLPDGSTLLHDLLNRRFLTISADGKPGAFLELPRPPASTSTAADGPARGPMIMGGITNVRGYDARGWIYFSGSPFSATGETADSVPLLRWDRVKPTFDTVGFVRQPAGFASRTQRGGNVQVRMGVTKRFTPAETWGVAGDGSIVRVFPEPYRVGWLTGKGQAALGPVVPYTPIKVTEADKKEVIDNLRRSPGTTIMIGGAGGGARTAPPPPNMTNSPPEFADTKPPYDGQGAVQVAPEGEVWILRTRPAGDKVPTYDVFDRSGKLVKKVSLNPNSRVVGFGKGVVYVARTDEDDLQYLQRFARP
jgi:hypothetical protein